MIVREALHGRAMLNEAIGGDRRVERNRVLVSRTPTAGPVGTRAAAADERRRDTASAARSRSIGYLLNVIRLKSSRGIRVRNESAHRIRNTVGGALCTIGTAGTWSCTKSSALR